MKEIYAKEENFGNDIFVDGLTIAEKENGHYFIETVKGPMASGIRKPYDHNSTDGWSIEVSTDSEEFDRGSDEYSLLLALKNFVDDYKVNTDEDKKEYLIQEIESTLRELVLYKWFKTDEKEIEDVKETILKKIEENDVVYFAEKEEDESIYAFLKEQNVLNPDLEKTIKDTLIALIESAFDSEFIRFEDERYGHENFSLNPFVRWVSFNTHNSEEDVELSDVTKEIEMLKAATVFATDCEGETYDDGRGGYSVSTSTSYCDFEFEANKEAKLAIRVGYELTYNTISF